MRYKKIMALPLSRSGYGRNDQQGWLFRTIHAEPSNACIMMEESDHQGFGELGVEGSG